MLNKLLQTFFLALLCNVLTSCNGQIKTGSTIKSKLVGGPFEKNDFIYHGIPKTISAIDTSPGFKLDGQKLLITGIVFKNDGLTPAPDVLLYYYQTGTTGKYDTNPVEPRNMQPNNLGQTHGYIRGWVKTGQDGEYYIYTVRPAPYPTFDEPAHIHFNVKEPNDINEYYIDDILFEDDPLLTTEKRNKLENRCGSGVVRLVKQNDVYVGERNIILGLNIPDYPESD